VFELNIRIFVVTYRTYKRLAGWLILRLNLIPNSLRLFLAKFPLTPVRYGTVRLFFPSKCETLLTFYFQGRLELRYRDVGGDELRGAPLLELVQSGCHQGHRERLQVGLSSPT
jgi:hypothetical protein